MLYAWARPRTVIVSPRMPSSGTSDALMSLERSGIPLLRTWQRGAIHFQWHSDHIITEGFLDHPDQPRSRPLGGGKTHRHRLPTPAARPPPRWRQEGQHSNVARKPPVVLGTRSWSAKARWRMWLHAMPSDEAGEDPVGIDANLGDIGGHPTPMTDSIDSFSISCSHNNLGRRFLEV